MRTYEQLTGAEVARAKGRLVEVCGGEESAERFLPRIAIDDEGGVRLAIKFPTCSEADRQQVSRVLNPSWERLLGFEVRYLGLTEGVALLRSDGNPERVLDARIRERNEELEEDRRQDAQRSVEHNARVARQRESEKWREDQHGETWDEMPGASKVLFHAALLAEKLAADIRALGDRFSAATVAELFKQHGRELRTVAGTGVLVYPSGSPYGVGPSLKRRDRIQFDAEAALRAGPPLPQTKWWP